MSIHLWDYGVMIHKVDTPEQAVELIKEKFAWKSPWGTPNVFIGLYITDGSSNLRDEKPIIMPWDRWPEDLNEVKTFLEAQIERT